MRGCILLPNDKNKRKKKKKLRGLNKVSLKGLDVSELNYEAILYGMGVVPKGFRKPNRIFRPQQLFKTR